MSVQAIVWQVVSTDEYRESYEDLGDSEDSVLAAKYLEFRVASEPEEEDPFPGCLQIRVNKTNSNDGYTPLRLYYWIEDRIVYLARIERYDENEEA